MKSKAPNSVGINVGLFFAFIFGVLFIGSLMPGREAGSPVVYFLLLCGSIYYLKSCIDERKKYFVQQRELKREAERKNDIEHEVSRKAKSNLIVCTHLGGSGYKFNDSEKFFLALSDDGILIANTENGNTRNIGLHQIHEIEVSGPGTVTTNAGISGGGFGLEGFLKGAVTAAVINAATTKSSTNTFARILTTEGEIYLHTAAIEPAALKIMLSPVFVSIANRSRKPNENIQATVAQEIEKLHKLKQDGLLDEAEFKAAKNKLLGL